MTDHQIPYVDLVAQNKLVEEEVLAAVIRVMAHGQFILGPEVEELERTLCSYLSCKHVVSVNSGTDALTLALKASGIGYGDEVITVSHSFVATAAAISLVGAKPVFIDIKPSTMLIDPEKITDAITNKTKAIMPVHLNGYPCEIKEIKNICIENQLTLIEDAAQGIGVKINNKHVGTDGIGCFSLHPLKLLGACGDGGFIATNSDSLAQRLHLMRNIGLKDREHCDIVAGNSRLDTIQAAILLEKFKYLDDWIALRQEHAIEYNKAFRELCVLPYHESSVRCTHMQYVLRHEARDLIIDKMIQAGIDVKVHYPLAIHQHPPYKLHNLKLPHTENLVNTMFSLPCSHTLSSSDRNIIIKTLKNILNHL